MLASILDISINKIKKGPIILTKCVQNDDSVISIFVKNGSSNENQNNNGISHFIEHMVFNGSKKFPKNITNEILNKKFSYYSAYTTREYTNFLFKTKNLLETISFIFNILRFPRFNTKDIKNEAKTILKEHESVNSNLIEKKLDFVHKKLFKNALGYPILGPVSNIKSFSKNQLKKFHLTTYKPENFLICVSSKYTHNQILEIIANTFYKSKKSKKFESNIFLDKNIKFDNIVNSIKSIYKDLKKINNEGDNENNNCEKLKELYFVESKECKEIKENKGINKAGDSNNEGNIDDKNKFYNDESNLKNLNEIKNSKFLKNMEISKIENELINRKRMIIKKNDIVGIKIGGYKNILHLHILILCKILREKHNLNIFYIPYEKRGILLFFKEDDNLDIKNKIITFNELESTKKVFLNDIYSIFNSSKDFFDFFGPEILFKMNLLLYSPHNINYINLKQINLFKEKIVEIVK
ncbi:insulinase M16 peptidase [Hamiltosporidium tvaerminnensis]|uniref:Alpha-MPP n=1 Tax=Hamiltosporidium tvaerminnensis TaxID=1176355 RepID=A0A4Q9L6M8_9MICR|nr:insulinase M16 peptidase [Hamiltosporidium tvaerminnensis]